MHITAVGTPLQRAVDLSDADAVAYQVIFEFEMRGGRALSDAVTAALQPQLKTSTQQRHNGRVIQLISPEQPEAFLVVAVPGAFPHQRPYLRVHLSQLAGFFLQQ